MHFNALLGLAFVAVSAAEYSSKPVLRFDRRNVQTLATIKSTLKQSTADIKEVNTGIKALTAANAKQQLGTVNAALMKLSSGLSANAKKMRSSGAVGIGEVMGLLGEAGRNELIGQIGGLTSALNETIQQVMEKKDIVKNSGAVDTVVPGIKSQKQPLVDIIAMVPSQIPGIAKGVINNVIGQFAGGLPGAGGAAPAAAPAPAAPAGKGGKGKGGAVTIDNVLTPQLLETIGNGIDAGLDQVIAVLKGTQEGFNFPKGKAPAPKGPPAGAAAPDAMAGMAGMI